MGVTRLRYTDSVAEHAEALAPELADFPLGSALPSRLVPVVNDLHARGSEIVTLADLSRYDTEMSPQDAGRALRRAGWLHPLRTRRAWSVNFVMSPAHLGGFRELRARLSTHPDTPVVIAGKSVAQVHDWLRRGTARSIGCPPNYKLPRCLTGYRVCRWEPRIPVDVVWGLPIWKPETLLVFMAARPSQFSWADIADWLWEACDSIDADVLSAELDGRPRSTWVKTGYLLNEGERPDIADLLLESAPSDDTGPYVLGHRERRVGRFIYQPVWSPKFELMDYLLPAWWQPRI